MKHAPDMHPVHAMQQYLVITASLISLCLLTLTHVGADTQELSGRHIMDSVYERHEQFPYVYEEQIMILVDKAGNRDTRKLRRYSRITSKQGSRYMLLFDDPPEVRGVALLTYRSSTGKPESSIYLPAYGPKLIPSIGQNESNNFLGTDFSVNDLLPEILDDFQYKRQDNQKHVHVEYFVIDVYSRQEPEIRLRRHFIRQDNYYITRTDSFDRHGRLHKRQTHHDLKYLGGAMWRANMIRIVDYKVKHQSLIKISRRVFSRDYVPEHMFSLEWLVQNQHMAQQPEPQKVVPEEFIEENKIGDKNVSQTYQEIN